MSTNIESQPVAAPLPPGPNPRIAVALLLGINMFNYIDRQVLAAVEVKISEDFRQAGEIINDAEMGFLSTAFLLSYMIASPLFGFLSAFEID